MSHNFRRYPIITMHRFFFLSREQRVVVVLIAVSLFGFHLPQLNSIRPILDKIHCHRKKMYGCILKVVTNFQLNRLPQWFTIHVECVCRTLLPHSESFSPLEELNLFRWKKNVILLWNVYCTNLSMFESLTNTLAKCLSTSISVALNEMGNIVIRFTFKMNTRICTIDNQQKNRTHSHLSLIESFFSDGIFRRYVKRHRMVKGESYYRTWWTVDVFWETERERDKKKKKAFQMTKWTFACRKKENVHRVQND